MRKLSNRNKGNSLLSRMAEGNFILSRKAESGGPNWKLVLSIIVAIVILAVLFIFILPKVSSGGFSSTASGFGEWLLQALTTK